MNTVNSWWANMPNERYWLVVARLDEMKDALVIPEERSQDVAAWVNQLPAYIPRRDVVFQYDSESRAIAAWSRARGPAARHEPGRSNGHSPRASWLVKVHGWRLLHTPVSIDEIARAQYDFFPALRTLEDKVGDPLYYPFAMGSPTETHLLPGKLFKLPAVFVEQFSPLAAVADETRTAEHGGNLRQHTASWWGSLEDFMHDRPRTARAR